MYAFVSRAAALVAVLGGLAVADPADPPDLDRKGQGTEFDEQADSERDYLNSGWVSAQGVGAAPVLIFDGVVEIPGKMWIRLRFGAVTLSGERGDANASYLVISSEADGAVQTLWIEDLETWSMSSAYFNGDRVRVQLYASPRSGPSRVQVNGAEFGEPGWLDRSLCGSTDDRFLSADPRTGRVLPSQCTAWLVSDLTSGLLTAGHCAIGARSVVEFNVPVSTVGGSMVHPDPADQYPVDPESRQTQTGSIGVGNDWMFFGIFPNTSTGRTALATQGQTHHLASVMPPNDNRLVAVVGYGQVAQPTPLEHNYAQTAGVGAYRGSSTNIVKYMTDTSGGNSGSPVLDLTTGLAIGIHTNGVCNSNGYNRGTTATRSTLVDALAHPLGRAGDTGGVLLSYPQGRPAEINPGGGTKIVVRVRASETRTPVAGMVRLHVFDGVSWSESFLEPTSGDSYRGTFPPVAPCIARLWYFVSVENTVGEIDLSPANGDMFVAEVTRPSEVLGAFSFELADGWEVSNEPSLRTGAWTVDHPPTVGRLGPKSDFDASGRCLLTGAASREDVDGGQTSVVSPPIRTCSQSDAYLSMAVWHAATTPGDGGLSIEISANRGGSWTQIDRVVETDGWEMRVFRIRDFVTPGSELLIRFTASDSDSPDSPEGGIVESAVDRIKVFEPTCSGASHNFKNGQGLFDLDDIEQFIRAVSTDDVSADRTGDGAVDIADLLDLVRGSLVPCH